jgi:hypothetical protein
MPLHPESERLDPANHKPRNLGRDVPAKELAGLVTGFLDRIVAPDHDTGRQIAVTAEILCRAMHGYIDPELQRPLVKRCSESIVGDRCYPEISCRRNHLRDIGYLNQRIRRRLYPEELCFRAGGLTVICGVGGIDERRLNAEAAFEIVEQVRGRGVHRSRCDNMVTLLRKRKDRRRDRGHARSKGEGVLRRFKLRYRFFQGVLCRVPEPAIEVARLFVVVYGDPFVRIGERKDRSRIYRNGNRAEAARAIFSCVNCECGK